jgi:cysteine sulfinate desulfinase/cysteine desulfurase-like protein
MGNDAETALGAIGLTLGRGTTQAHVNTAAEVLGRAWCHLRDEP